MPFFTERKETALVTESEIRLAWAEAGSRKVAIVTWYIYKRERGKLCAIDDLDAEKGAPPR